MQFKIHTKVYILFFTNYDKIISMDELSKNKFRSLGAIAITIVAVFFIVLLFVQQREKKNISLKLKAFNSEVIQALLISKNENGIPEDWCLKPGYKNIDTLKNNVFKYLRIDEDCTENPGTCFFDGNYKSIKEKETNFNLYNFPSVKMKNGISIAIETISKCSQHNEICAIVYIDINNIEEPNAFGKDMFVFAIINNGSQPFKPYDMTLTEHVLKNDTKYGCNKESKAAIYCAAMIAQNGWKIDSSYPW